MNMISIEQLQQCSKVVNSYSHLTSWNLIILINDDDKCALLGAQKLAREEKIQRGKWKDNQATRPGSAYFQL